MRSVILAAKTVSKINAMIQQDQGASFRARLGQVIGHMSDAYRSEKEDHRTHLGASVIGHECARSIWYGFRWMTKKSFDGRTLRLFNRGHLEEGRFIAMLLMIGCQIYQQDEHGKQFRISHAGGHFGGSGDGVASGIPDLPDGTWALLEFKTHNDKSFEQVKKLGVRDAKFEHYVQMNVYAKKMGLAVSLYMAVNKNNDEIYAELIPLDTAIADQFVDRAEKIIWAKDAPPKINESAGFYKCHWCDHRPVCHLGAVPDVNCRTCANSEPSSDGNWACKKHGISLDKAQQLAACPDYAQIKVPG